MANISLRGRGRATCGVGGDVRTRVGGTNRGRLLCRLDPEDEEPTWKTLRRVRQKRDFVLSVLEL
jgi:hypothetical protein